MKLMTSWCKFLKRSFTSKSGNDTSLHRPPLSISSSSKKRLYKRGGRKTISLQPSKRSRKKKISAALRRSVWEDNVGKFYSGHCTCCKRTMINVFDFQCGHVIAESEGGPTTLDNLRPICALCNMSSGTEQMFDFAMRNGF